MRNILRVEVDIKGLRRITPYTVTQNDSVRLIVKVLDGGVPVNLDSVATASIAFTRIDGQVVVKTGEQSGTNEITFDLGTTEIEIIGKVEAVVQLYAADNRVSTIRFTFEVTKDPTGDSFVPSKNERTLIEVVLGDGPLVIDRAESAAVNAENATAYLDEKKSLIDKFTSEQTSLQAQLDQVAIGATNAETSQARVNAEGTAYSTLKARLDAENRKVNEYLAQTASQDYVNTGLDLKRNKNELIKTTDLSEEVKQQMTGNTPINSIPENYSVDYLKMKYPNGYITAKEFMTVNLQTRKVTFNNNTHIVNGSTPLYVPKPTYELDLSTVPDNDVTLCYYSPSDNQIKYARFNQAEAGVLVLFYKKGSDILGVNSHAIKIIDSNGIEAKSELNNFGLFVATSLDSFNIDFEAGNIHIPNGYIQHTKNYYSVSRRDIAISNVSGVHALFYDADNDSFIHSRYNDYPTSVYNKKNLILIAVWYQGGAGNFLTSPTQIQVNGKYFFEKYLPSYNPVKNRLLLPPKMFFVDDNPLPIYQSSIVATVDNNYILKTALSQLKNNVPKVEYFTESLELESSNLADTFNINLKENNTDNMYFGTITKKSVDGSAHEGNSFKLLCIGDSLTNKHVIRYAKERLSQYGVAVNTIGTMDNSGEKGEGREGWKYSNFIGKDNVRSSDNKRIQLQPTGSTSDIYQNPFLKLATEQDKTEHPTWCFRNTGAKVEKSYAEDTDKTGNFYIFDFEHYLNNHSVDTPDVITIALSTNDINGDNVNAIANCKLALEIMVKQIKKALPNVKIGIIPAHAWLNSANMKGNWENFTTSWIEQCMKDVATYQGSYSDLDIIPMWCHMDRNFTYPTNNVNISSDNTTKKGTYSDFVHFGEIGQRQYAEVVASYIMNVI